MPQEQSYTLLTPQGDGNMKLIGFFRELVVSSYTLLTPQGDGNPQ